MVEVAYVDYMRLSLDAVHCSLSALNRHVTKELISDSRTEVTLTVEAKVTPAEWLSTILHLCRALTGVAITANELLGFTSASGKLTELFEEFEKNGWVHVK